MPANPPPLDEDGLPPLWDPGNTLLATGLPALLMTGKVPSAGGGETGIVTIRTQDTTLFLSLDKKSAQDWADTLAELAGSLPAPSSLVIPSRHITPAVAVIPPEGGRTP